MNIKDPNEEGHMWASPHPLFTQFVFANEALLDCYQAQDPVAV